MNRRRPMWLLVVPFFLPLFDCHSRVDINNAFQRIERTWQLDYQRTEDEYRWRVVESDPATTYRAVRQTFLDIGLPIQNESISGQTLIAQHQAPLPLTIEEWKQVAKEENPRLREIAPWFIYLPDNPEKYIVTVKATIKPFEDRTFVVLDYTIDAPEYRRMGYTPTRHGPPAAVRMATLKIWRMLKEKLETMRVKEPRRRQPDEFEI